MHLKISTRCPAGSEYRHIVKQILSLSRERSLKKKKKQAFSHGQTLTTLPQQTYESDNHVSISSSGVPFCHAQYQDVLGNDQTESGIWVREIDHIHYRRRKLVTLRLRCENVSNRLNISRTKKNVVTTYPVRNL